MFKHKNSFFGYLFSLIFFLLTFLDTINDIKTLRYTLITLSVIFLSITIFKPQKLDLPRNLWINLGLLLGKITSPIILGMVYFLIIFPINIILNILRINNMNPTVKFYKRAQKYTYWNTASEKKISMKDQF